MPRHHFVPQFMLRRWASKGKLVAYRWHEGAGKVLETDPPVAAACQVEDLNAYRALPRDQKNFPEEQFTRRIDTPAAQVLEAMLADGVEHLSAGQRSAWARFLVSFAVRTPEALRKLGPAKTREAFEIVGKRASGPPHLEAQASAIIKDNLHHFQRNMLRDGRPESLETTSLHLDVLRDLKRIHSHICSVAYPALDAAGQMPAAEVAESDPIILAASKSTTS